MAHSSLTLRGTHRFDGTRRLDHDERRAPTPVEMPTHIVRRRIEASRWNAPTSIPMPDVTHTVRYAPGFVLVDPENLDRKGEPRYRNIWQNGDPAGSTIQRRWSKRGRAVQTQTYLADPYIRTGCDGSTRTEPGSRRRVGNVPSGLVPPSLSGIAAMMTRPYEADGDDD